MTWNVKSLTPRPNTRPPFRKECFKCIYRMKIILFDWYFTKKLPMIITWLLCFSPGFNRFIPGFDRFIPGFDRFIPARIPVTGTLPLQSKCTLANKMCIVLHFEIILFHIIWNKYFLLKKTFIISENKYFCWKNKVDTNPRLPRFISMPQTVDCDPQAVTGVSQVL